MRFSTSAQWASGLLALALMLVSVPAYAQLADASAKGTVLD